MKRNRTNKRLIRKIIITVIFTVLSFTLLRADIVNNVLHVRKITYCKLLTSGVTQTTVPFTIDHGRIIVEVTIKVGKGKEKKQKLVLDTGAPLSFTDDYAKSEMMNTESVEMRSVAFGGQETTETNYLTADPVTISIGEMQILQPHVNIQAIKAAELKCDGAVGLLGSNVLSKFIVTINFKNLTITLSQKKGFDYKRLKGNIHKVSFIPLFMQNNPYLQVTYNGESFTGLLDSGDPGMLMFQYKGELPGTMTSVLKDTASTRCFETFGNIINVNGVVKEKGQAYTVKQAHITIDNDTLPAPSISVLPRQSSKGMSMGLNFLRQYECVVIDWNKDDLYLIDPLSQPIPPVSDFLIRHLADEGRFLVGAVDTRSSFYNKGLRAGDEIISINGHNLTDLTSTTECDLTDQLKSMCKEAAAIEINRGATIQKIAK